MNSLPEPARWKRMLRFFSRSSIRRDATLAVVIIGLLGAGLIFHIDGELGRQAATAEVVNASGRLRMLSQRLAYTTTIGFVERAGTTQQTAAGLRREFATTLANVEQKGRSLGLFPNGSDAAYALGRLRVQWENYARLTRELEAKSMRHESLTPGAMDSFDSQAENLLAAAESTVQTVLPQFERQRQRFAFVMPLAIGVGLLIVLASYLFIHRRILAPLAKIATMSDRHATGDFSARANHGRDDEIGHLIEHLNKNADTLQGLQAERDRAEAALRESEVRSRTLLEVSTDAIVMIDRDSVIRFTNPAVQAIFGYSSAELVGRPLATIQPVHLRDAHLAGFRRFVEKGDRRLNWNAIQLTALHRSGREVPIELSFAHMTLADGDWFVGFFRDISQRMETQSTLLLRDRAIQATGEGVMISDAVAADHPLVYVNPALEKITGYPAAELVGRNARLLLGNELDQPGVVLLSRLLRGGEEGSVQLRCFRRDGSPFWIELSIAPVRDQKNVVRHYISILKDISDRKRYEAELLHSANYDALTGLPNRALLTDRLGQICHAPDRRHRTAGLLFIDLDHFKVVNDSLGHAVGDQLLKQVAERLLVCARDGDTLARLGGDEFVLLLADLSQEEDIALVAQRALATLAQPLMLGEAEVVPQASIGGAVFPRDGETPELLLQRADIAMYRAKEQGRNGFQLYTEEMQARINSRLRLETQMRKAIERNEFQLYYQPQIDLRTNRIIGAEALIRWQHPELGLVSPGYFIPVAEESDLILPIGQWVLEAACQQLAECASHGFGDLTISVNVSARQVKKSNLVNEVHDALSRFGILARNLELEITESLAMGDPATIGPLLREIRSLGVACALDDFGTGYSNLSYLRSYPVNRLKIDRSFIHDYAIVHAVVQLAHSFGLQVVAEGVEDQAAFTSLRDLNCDTVQGYFCARPMPATELMEFLARQPEPAREAKLPT